jgi:trehalose 6-phosphate synthase/phosphatase
MNRLLIVSNRLPWQVNKRAKGFALQSNVGGLATGLVSFYQIYKSMWIGWSGISHAKLNARDQKKMTAALQEKNCYPLQLTKQQIEE